MMMIEGDDAFTQCRTISECWPLSSSPEQVTEEVLSFVLLVNLYHVSARHYARTWEHRNECSMCPKRGPGLERETCFKNDSNGSKYNNRKMHRVLRECRGKWGSNSA